jgi:hypothetical protein
MRAWGLKLQDSQILIDCLLDWVDQDPLMRLNGAETKSYGIPGYPFNRPFRTIDEMALVRGMDYVERLYPSWREWFSVDSSGVVDLNETTAEIITALTGADMRFSSQMVARRAGQDGVRNTEDDLLYPDVQSALLVLNIPPQYAQRLGQNLGVNSSIKRIESTGVAGEFRRTIYAVVRGAPNGGGASQVMRLGEQVAKEDVGDFAQPQQRATQRRNNR